VEYQRDPEHWLYRLSPEEWVSAALTELERAEAAFSGNNVPGAYACLKRAAGMALNGALIVRPNEEWGRTYVQHVRALTDDASAPEAVRAAARRILEQKPSTGPIVRLRTTSHDQALLEAARTVMAHAYAIMRGVAKATR
jgi:hypothetical protein